MKARPAYARLSVAGKQAHQLEQMREPSVTCPRCETQTSPADLLAHLSTRCTGPREPHRGSRWISWGEATRMGVPDATMSRWTNRGLVRSRGAPNGRRYLLRDLVHRLADRRARRDSHR